MLLHWHVSHWLNSKRLAILMGKSVQGIYLIIIRVKWNKTTMQRKKKNFEIKLKPGLSPGLFSGMYIYLFFPFALWELSYTQIHRNQIERKIITETIISIITFLVVKKNSLNAVLLQLQTTRTTTTTTTATIKKWWLNEIHKSSSVKNKPSGRLFYFFPTRFLSA